MGLIKPTELANGNVGLEIIYGGVEAPFGGIDASMPPPYIDPKCQEEILGFVVAKSCLAAVSMQPYAVTLPALAAPQWLTPANAEMAGFGHFYSDDFGYMNFIVVNGGLQNVAGISSQQVGIYFWQASQTIPSAALQFLTLTQSIGTVATSATGTFTTGVVPNQGGAGTLSSKVFVNGIQFGPFTEATPELMATDITNAINANPLCLATAIWAVVTPGVQALVTMTAITPGAAGNGIGIGFGTIDTGGRPAGPFGIVTDSTNFAGGADATTFPTLAAPFPISYQSVGENLYIAGPGNVMLKFQVNPSILFEVLQQYVGAAVLKKFGGYLIGMGIYDGAGTFIQSAQMVMAWSANQNYSQWNPVDVSGNVTGAGFEQLADISDYLTGGIVASSTMAILRANGISFASLTGNSTVPFDVNHVDLAENSEGCPSLQGASQYNQFGFFLGNSNVYQYAQGLSAIGDKIKSILFPLLTPGNSSTATSSQYALAKALSLYLSKEETIYFCIFVDPYIFIYNVHAAAWSRLNFILPAGTTSVYLNDLLAGNSVAEGYSKQSLLTLGIGDNPGLFTAPPPLPTFNFFTLQEQLPVAGDAYNGPPSITFSQEEIMLGRDITVDSLYVLVAGTAGLRINFSILDITGTTILTTVLTLPVGASYDKFIGYPLYFDALSTTVKSPQLKATPVLTGSFQQCRIAKISMFASFDSKQKPT